MGLLIRRRSTAVVMLALSAAIAVPRQPAAALPPPIGAIAADRRLLQGVSENSDELNVSPFLLQIAKLVGRIGLSPGFFLQDGGLFSTEPGVDLRTLLLYQAGLLKLPLQKPTGKAAAHKDEPQLPSLNVPEIPEPRLALNGGRAGDDATAARLPSLAGEIPPEQQPDLAAGSTNRPPKQSDKAKQASTILKVDTTALFGNGGDTPKQKKLPSLTANEVPLLAMALPHAVQAPAPGDPQFRFWTQPEQSSSGQAGGTTATPIDSQTDGYNGAFVVATRGGISSITGRSFCLTSGRALAHNAEGALVLVTPLASVSVKPGATVLLETSEANGHRLTKIFALEQRENVAAVVETSPPSQVASGEVVVISDQPLTPPDLAGLNSDDSRTTTNVARAKFSVASAIAKEPLLQAADDNSERALTLQALKRRLSQP